MTIRGGYGREKLLSSFPSSPQHIGIHCSWEKKVLPMTPPSQIIDRASFLPIPTGIQATRTSHYTLSAWLITVLPSSPSQDTKSGLLSNSKAENRGPLDPNLKSKTSTETPSPLDPTSHFPSKVLTVHAPTPPIHRRHSNPGTCSQLLLTLTPLIESFYFNYTPNKTRLPVIRNLSRVAQNTRIISPEIAPSTRISACSICATLPWRNQSRGFTLH